MSNRSQATQGMREDHPSTFHGFFLAAKENGYKDFDLQLVTSPKGKIEFYICPRGRSAMGATFDVRGNTVRVALSEANDVHLDDADVRIDYGGTRSGEEPVSMGARSSPSRRPATVTDRDPQRMDWSL